MEFKIDPDKVAKICYDFYDKNLLVKSKPALNEWTNMAAILSLSTKDKENSNFKIISMATGSKCLAEKQLPQDGSLVHDSHAEVLARRCFIRYLYNEMNELIENKNHVSEILELGNKKFSVKPNLEFILFTSHTPCGDSSIIPKPGLKRDLEDPELLETNKKCKLDEDDIYRTGAKCVPNSSIQDSKEKGVSYHVTGVIRTKPGRGDPTISMSCSDKIAKWLVLGLQGALLSFLLDKPIYLKAIVIAKCPYNFECIKRALIDRSNEIKNLADNFKLTIPLICQSELIFKDSKLAKYPDDVNDSKACPNSVCWTLGVKTKQTFVLVKGNLQGAAKSSNNKNKKLPTVPPISKYAFLNQFSKFYSEQEDLTYDQAKNLSKQYLDSSKEFFKIYNDWIRTDPEKYYKFKLFK